MLIFLEPSDFNRFRAIFSSSAKLFAACPFLFLWSSTLKVTKSGQCSEFSTPQCWRLNKLKFFASDTTLLIYNRSSVVYLPLISRVAVTRARLLKPDHCSFSSRKSSLLITSHFLVSILPCPISMVSFKYSPRILHEWNTMVHFFEKIYRNSSLWINQIRIKSPYTHKI